MIIVGFDPGITGAGAAIRIGDMGAVELIDIIDLPTAADGVNREIDVPALGAWLELIEPDIAYVENVTPMPSLQGNRSMGATSAFRFGGAVFALRATLKSYGIPVVLKTPQTWKTAMGLRGSDKEKSRKMAIARLPAAEPFLKRKLDHNRADSVLLALYGAAKQ